MSGEVRKRGSGDGARHGAGDGGQPPTPLREAELSVRQRGGAARTGGPQLLPGEPDQVLDASRRDGGAGASGNAALSRGANPPGEGGRGRPHRAGKQPGIEETSGPSNPFSASDALYQGVVGFLSGDAAAALTHSELEARLNVDARELVRQLYQDHPAPRGALAYPPRSGEGLEVISLGPMAHLVSKE